MKPQEIENLIDYLQEIVNEPDDCTALTHKEASYILRLIQRSETYCIERYVSFRQGR